MCSSASAAEARCDTCSACSVRFAHSARALRAVVKIATKPDEIARALGEQTRPRGPPSTELAVTVCGQLRLRFA
jgi:hypothetical protein